MNDFFHYLDQGFSLRTTGVILGVILIASHLYALMRGEAVRHWLRHFPRNLLAGQILFTLAAAWCMVLIWNMDMGEFENLRKPLKIITPLLYVGGLIYMTEYLSVRSLGILLLLVASPALNAAFLRPPVSRLLIPVLMYAWIIAGLYFVGKPYLLRDLINKITAKPACWKPLCLIGIVYGVLLVGFAVGEWGRYS